MIAVCGIGNRFRRDDGAGPSIIDRLRDPATFLPSATVLIDAGETPENQIDVLKDPELHHIIFLDAGELGAAPGSIAVVDPEDTVATTLSTHRIPLAVISRLIKTWNPEVRISAILIQPGDLGFGQGLSPEVEKAIVDVLDVLKELLL